MRKLWRFSGRKERLGRYHGAFIRDILAPLSRREKLLSGLIIGVLGFAVVSARVTATETEVGQIRGTPATSCHSDSSWQNPSFAEGMPAPSDNHLYAQADAETGHLVCGNFENPEESRLTPALVVYAGLLSEFSIGSELRIPEEQNSPQKLDGRAEPISANNLAGENPRSIDSIFRIELSDDSGQNWRPFHVAKQAAPTDNIADYTIEIPAIYASRYDEISFRIEPTVQLSSEQILAVDSVYITYEVGQTNELELRPNDENGNPIDVDRPVIPVDESLSFTLSSKRPGDGLLQGLASQFTSPISNAPGGSLELNGTLVSQSGDEINVEVQANFKNTDLSNTNKFSLDVVTPTSMDPGRYALVLDIEDENGATQQVQQDFLWGVLAMNFDKAPYSLADSGNIALSVLDEDGRSVCDAFVSLIITDPRNRTTTLTVGEQLLDIKLSDSCDEYGPFITPDYAAEYTFSEIGEYNIKLEAITEHGYYSISELLNVGRSSEVAFQRTGPTRVFPPLSYPMVVEISSASGFQGVVEERVPKSFKITPKKDLPDYTLRRDGDDWLLQWKLAIEPGQSKRVGYNFEVPSISPEFYLLGPITLLEDNKPAHQEPRQWQIAGDAIGNMLILFDGASIPTGWSCVSCTGGDAFYQNFIRGDSTYGGTGGSATHTHTAAGSVAATGAAGVTENSVGTSIAEVPHAHTYSPTLDSPSNLPSYRQLIVLRSDTSGEPTTLPAGAVIVFDDTVPGGWTRYSAQDTYYARGEAVANRGTTGGSNTHQVAITGNTAAGTNGSIYKSRGGGSQTTGAVPSHTHSVSSNTTSVNAEPPYVEAILGTIASDTAPPNNMIGMWDDEAPSDWVYQSDSGGPFYQKYIKGASAFGSTGGAATHTHSDVTGITSGGPSATTNARTGSTGASSGHNHSVDVTTFSSENNEPPYRNVRFAKKVAPPTIEQSAYRWYDNDNSADVGSSLAAQDTAANAPTQGTPFRLRSTLHVSTNDLITSGKSLKLQFATRSGTCDTAFVGETYADVATAAGAIRYYNNSTPLDGAALIGNANDPVHSAHTNDDQTYEESNNFTNSVGSITAGDDGLWDFSLIDNSATSNTTYCFRIVEGSGTVLDTYSVIPEITTDTRTVEQASFRFFTNADSTDVGAALAAQDTGAITPAQGTPFRLRATMHIDGSQLPSSGVNYKLQYATASGACDTGFIGETYGDVATASGAIRYFNNATPADGAALTGNVNDPVHSGHTTIDQTYEESNNFTNSQGAVAVSEDGMWDFALVDFSAPSDTDYCFRIVTSAAAVLDSYTVIPSITTAGVVLDQSSYRWYNNNDSTDVGTTLAAQDTVATSPSPQGTPFRLRMTMHISSSTLGLSAQNFKLQFAQRSGTCDTAFVGESYADVTAATAIGYYNNGTPADSAALTGNANDPIHSGHTTIDQTYEELNNFTNSQGAIAVGQDGMWDFSLVDNSAINDTAYCFRIIRSGGSVLNAYTVVPQITTPNISIEQSAYRWYENTDSTDAGTAMAAQDTTITTPDQGNAFRLRLNLHVTIAQMNVNDETFKLQFATRSGTCDTAFVGETYADVATGSGTIRYYDNTTPADEAALTDNAADPVHSGDTNVNQSYQEANNFSNSVAAIPVGDDGLWDFVLVDDSAPASTAFCFRVVFSGGTVIDTYSVIPEITTAIAVGNMILLWDGGAAPAGWTCVSCSGGDDFYQRFIRGEATYGTTGGAETHSHTASGSVSATGDAASTEASAGALIADNSHAHAYTPTLDPANNLPPYRQLKVIRNNASGHPATIPTGVIGFFDAAVPAGWTRYSAQDGSYIRGENTVGTTGGSSTHTVNIAGATGAATGTTQDGQNGGSQTDGAAAAHTHSVSGTSAAGNNVPPYIETILGKLDSTDVVPARMIAMWDDVIPADWTVISGSGDPFYQRFVEAQSTYGTTGGTTTHNHTDTTGLTSGTPSATDNGRVGAFGADNLHTHTVDVTGYSTENHLPSYINVIMGKKDNGPPNDPTSLIQKKVTGGATLAVGDWTDETQVRFEANATDPDNPDTLELCVEIQPLGTAFTDTENSCGTGVAYSGSAVTVIHTLSGLSDSEEFHWQVRTRDTVGDYSAWVSYGANAESARDVGVDSTDPTGTVYDGPIVAVDADINGGELDEISVNWSIDYSVSGQNGDYDYSIGTTPGGIDILGWTTTAATAVTAGGLSLNTSQIYYFNVRATDNAGNIVVISSDGSVVAPTLSFTTSPGQVVFDNLNAGNSYTDTETVTLTTSTNAYNGYIIRAFSEGSLTSQNGDSVGFFDGGSYAAPDEWLAPDRGYGYTSNDSSIQGADIFNITPCPGGGNPGCYAPFSITPPGDIVADHTAVVIGTPISNENFVLTHQVRVDSSQESGTYTTVVVYTAIATY